MLEFYMKTIRANGKFAALVWKAIKNCLCPWETFMYYLFPNPNYKHTCSRDLSDGYHTHLLKEHNR